MEVGRPWIDLDVVIEGLRFEEGALARRQVMVLLDGVALIGIVLPLLLALSPVVTAFICAGW